MKILVAVAAIANQTKKKKKVIKILAAAIAKQTKKK
jgi:hypothetical protein